MVRKSVRSRPSAIDSASVPAAEKATSARRASTDRGAQKPRVVKAPRARVEDAAKGDLQAARIGDRTYARLRDDIVSCVLPPGIEVSEAQLAERYQVGKAPIRSSLTRLRQDGLVEPLPRRGYLISPFTVRDVHEAYEARLVVESQCARLAAGRIDAAQLEALDRAVHVGYKPGDRASEARFLEANRSIHLTIAEASGNRRLAEVVRKLLLECDRIIHLAMQVDTSAEQRFQHGHQRIIDALREGDEAEAEREATAAIRAGRDLVLEVLLRSPSLLGAELRLPTAAGNTDRERFAPRL